MGPLFSHAKWTCELAIKWTQRQKSTGKSPHFSRSTVHGPRPHFIDTRKFVAVIKAQVDDTEGKKHSLWSIFAKNATDEKMDAFLRRISELFGTSVVKDLVLYEETIVKANEKMVDVMLDRLAIEDRDEVCSRVFTTDSVQNRLVDKGPDYVIKRYLGIDYRGMASNLPDGFNVLALYFIEQFDKDQLTQFAKFISSVQ